MLAQQVNEFGQAALLVRAQMVMDVPTEVILAEVIIVIGASADNQVERVEAEIARFAELSAQRGILHPATQSPDGIDERQFGQFVPSGAEVPKVVPARGPQQIQRRVAYQQRIIRQRGARSKSSAGSPINSA